MTYRFLVLLFTACLSLPAIAHLAASPVGAVEASLVQVQHNAYLMTAPNAATGNVSELHIINTSDESQQFYGSVYDKDGNLLGQEQTLFSSASIPAKGRLILSSEDVSTLVGDTWAGPAVIEIFGADSFAAMIRLASPSSLVSNTNCVTEEVVHNLEGFDTTNLPYVRFINTTQTTLTDIRGSLYDSNGALIGTGNQALIASLAPKAQRFLDRNDLASIFGVQWDGTASLYVRDITGLKLLQVTFIIESSTFFNYTCFDGNDDLDNPVPAEADEGVVEITNAIFTATSADCATYAADYTALATDVFNNVQFNAEVTVTDGGTTCSLTSNAIPNHDFHDTQQGFAHSPATIERTFNLPRNPSLASASTSLTQGRYDAIMLNGVVLDLLSAGCYNPSDPTADQDGNTTTGCNANDDWLIDPLGTEHKFGADSHNAHTQPDGTYHYHGNPNAMFDDSPGPSGSPVIGFAADGFPVYGTYFLDPQTDTVRKAVSGYSLKSGSRGQQSNSNPGGTYDGTYVDDYEFTGNGDLDACNGMTVSGQYAYYVTDTYPWVLKCHSGTPDNSFSK